MKKFILLFVIATVAAIASTGCKDETRCVTSDFVIINRVESDVVVELKFGDRQTMTIEPGKTQLIYSIERCHPANVELTLPAKLLEAEMRIDGEVMPESVWLYEYWDSDGRDSHVEYTLIVTDELLETITNQQQN